MASSQALIFIGGDAPHAHAIDFALTDIDADALVIAADSGWEYALATKRMPSVLIGDMDSINPEHLKEALNRGVEIIEYSPDKDHTDTELALRLAESLHYENIHVISGGGDRFDHVLAMVHSLVNVTDTATITAHIGQSFVRIATPQQTTSLFLNEGDTVSLIPLGGNAKGVTTTGLKWNLSRSTLKAFESRGVSNKSIANNITVSIRTGVIAIIITPANSEERNQQ